MDISEMTVEVKPFFEWYDVGDKKWKSTTNRIVDDSCLTYRESLMQLLARIGIKVR